MTKRSIRFVLLISLVASACSGAGDQTSKITPFDETINAPSGQTTTSSAIEISDNAFSGETANTEKKITESPGSIGIFEDFSSNFSDGNPEINRTHPFQSLDTFCTTYPPVKEEIVPSGHQPDNYLVERIHCESHDGRKIPLTITRHKNTKLDGSAKGGILLSLAEKFNLPVHAIGVGEKIEDLQSFEASEFAKSLMGLEN